MADLKPHEQRVLAERDELLESLRKLDTFINSRQFVNLAPEDRELLIIQQHLMDSLNFVLARRISRFATTTAGVTAAPAPDGDDNGTDEPTPAMREAHDRLRKHIAAHGVKECECASGYCAREMGVPLRDSRCRTRGVAASEDHTK